MSLLAGTEYVCREGSVGPTYLPWLFYAGGEHSIEGLTDSREYSFFFFFFVLAADGLFAFATCWFISNDRYENMEYVRSNYVVVD